MQALPTPASRARDQAQDSPYWETQALSLHAGAGLGAEVAGGATWVTTPACGGEVPSARAF